MTDIRGRISVQIVLQVIRSALFEKRRPLFEIRYSVNRSAFSLNRRLEMPAVAFRWQVDWQLIVKLSTKIRKAAWHPVFLRTGIKPCFCQKITLFLLQHA